ncbi:MAG: 50S ribosomal protein L10 [Deltaproteobacteria bacterium]|jgi:large subunit ribosomal protein L10|nr:50S ribosomal protein L10 [Deltaproteobacteria bacterium]
MFVITRADKESEVKIISEKLAKSKAAFIVDFKGMKVDQVTDLRKKLHPVESEMKVVRNTLAKRALKDFPVMSDAISSAFKGTNAFVFAYGDVAAAAKTLSVFAKDIEVFQLKSGVMDGRKLDEKSINFIATLPGKDQLRAQFLALLNTPATQVVRVLNEVPTALARVLKAKSEIN